MGCDYYIIKQLRVRYIDTLVLFYFAGHMREEISSFQSFKTQICNVYYSISAVLF